MFDARGTCNGASNHFLLHLSERDCSRNGDVTIEADTSTTFRISSDNLGGTTTCGDPGMESIRLELQRSSCDGNTHDLVVSDSAPGSPFSMTVVAKRCRCLIGWQPCAVSLPEDPCAP
jgi:hypothetical protein